MILILIHDLYPKKVDFNFVCELVRTELLGLSPSSPDAAIFTNASSSTSSNATSGTPATPSTSQAQNDSFGFPLRPYRLSDLAAVASAVLVVAFPTGFAFN